MFHSTFVAYKIKSFISALLVSIFPPILSPLFYSFTTIITEKFVFFFLYYFVATTFTYIFFPERFVILYNGLKIIKYLLTHKVTYLSYKNRNMPLSRVNTMRYKSIFCSNSFCNFLRSVKALLRDLYSLPLIFSFCLMSM